MNSNKIVKVKYANKLPTEPKSLSQAPQQALVEQPEIGRASRTIRAGSPLEFRREPTRDESVYGSGWSLAALMNEFGGF